MSMREKSDAGMLASLRREVAGIGSGGGKMSDHQQLTCEALDCALHGDFAEARHRLRLRDRPKFHSEEQCKRQYKQAMESRV